MAGRSNLRWLLRALLLLAWLPAVTAAQGGGVRGLLDSSPARHQVEPEAVLGAANASFRDAAQGLLALGAGEPDPDRVGAPPEGIDGIEGIETLARERRDALFQEAVDAFQGAARLRVSALRGDGLLYADEVSAELGELREERLLRLAQVARAELAGVAPPPEREEFRSAWSYRAAVAVYIARERNGLWDWAQLLGAAFAGIALAIGVLKVSGWRLSDETEGWRATLHQVVRSVHGPLYLLLATGGLALGMRAIWIPAQHGGPVRATLLALFFVGILWMLWGLSASLPARVAGWVTPDGTKPGEQILAVVRKMLRLGLVVLFLFVGVELVLGVDLAALLAGLGLVGLAVTFAAQDTIKDLLAALTIHLNQPFVLGDLVRYKEFFGHVEEVGFRMTRIRTLDGHLVTVPNAKLISEAFENVGARPHVRRRFHLDLPYDTPLERLAKAVDVVREVIRDAGDLDPDQEVQVHFDEFGPHSFKLLVQYYYQSGDYWAAKEKATEIDLALVERMRAEEIEFAFPTQTLHVETAGGGVTGDDEDDEDDDEDRE